MEEKTTTSKLIHCNKCRGVLMKDVDTSNMEGKTHFLLRCPHCNENCSVTIEVGKVPIVTVN